MCTEDAFIIVCLYEYAFIIVGLYKMSILAYFRCAYLCSQKRPIIFISQYIDASKDVESLHTEIKGLARTIMTELNTEDIGTLWGNKSKTTFTEQKDLPEPPAKKPCTNGIATSNGEKTES